MNERNYSYRQKSTSPAPWEARRVQQVPYVEPSPANSGRKSSRTESASSITKSDSSSERLRSSTPGTEHKQRHWQTPAAYNQPAYETTFERHTSPGLPNAYAGRHVSQAPPSPPDSVKLRDNHSNSSASAAHHHHQQQQPPSDSLPRRDGRDLSQSNHRAGSQGRPPRLQTTGKKQSAGIGTKFKSAMKDLFHHSPVDAANCEPVKTKHWADDDY